MSGMSIFSALLNQNKPDLRVLTPVELDLLAESVTQQYLRKWVRLRVVLCNTEKKELNDDTTYSAVMRYVADLNGSFNITRLWTREGIHQCIWMPLQNNQELWDVIYRGYCEFSAKVYVVSTDNSKVSRSTLIKHVCDGLSGFNALDADDNSLEMVPKEIRDILPVYQHLVNIMEYNPWLLFIYYLTRADIYALIYGEDHE